MNKKMAAIGLTVGLAAGGVAGLVVAAPSLSGAQSATTEVDPVPIDPGSVPPPAEAPDRASRLDEALAPLVEDGTLTQEQADKVIEALRSAGPLGGRGPGHGPIAKGLDAAAEALGMSDDELRSALREGQTLAEVAESRGVDPQAVIDAVVAEAKTRLDEKVAAGDLTREDADSRLADATERITEMVNEGGPRGGLPGGRGDGHGDRAPR